MNEAQTILLGFGWLGVVLGWEMWGVFVTLRDIQLTLAKLPAHMNERREIVLPPREEARQGDVVFHIPSSLYGDRS